MGSLKEKLHSYRRRGKERAGQGCVLQRFGRNARSQLGEPALSGQRLNLVVAVIILRNTVYLERAI